MSSPATVEIQDAVFCQEHLQECVDCDFDGREDNDAFYGLDPIDRDAIEVPAVTQGSEGLYMCEKHGGATCSQCFAWRKLITRARLAAKKAGR